MVDADKVNESAAAPGMALVDELQKADGAEGNEAESGVSGVVESIPKGDEGQDAEKGSTMEEDSPAAAEEAPTILTGKRQRKSVEQWEPEVSKKRKSFEDVEVMIPEGRGTPLGEIPFLKEAIAQNKDFELLGLAHRFVFGTKGRAVTPKGYKQADLFRSNLYKFSGYLPLAGDDADKDKLEKLESEQEVRFICLSTLFFRIFYSVLTDNSPHLLSRFRKNTQIVQVKCQRTHYLKFAPFSVLMSLLAPVKRLLCNVYWTFWEVLMQNFLSSQLKRSRRESRVLKEKETPRAVAKRKLKKTLATMKP